MPFFGSFGSFDKWQNIGTHTVMPSPEAEDTQEPRITRDHQPVGTPANSNQRGPSDADFSMTPEEVARIDAFEDENRFLQVQIQQLTSESYREMYSQWLNKKTRRDMYLDQRNQLIQQLNELNRTYSLDDFLGKIQALHGFKSYHTNLTGLSKKLKAAFLEDLNRLAIHNAGPLKNVATLVKGHFKQVDGFKKKLEFDTLFPPGFNPSYTVSFDTFPDTINLVHNFLMEVLFDIPEPDFGEQPEFYGWELS